MADRKYGFDTLCLHAGQIPDAATGARALPIYQTTSFVFDSADHAASLFNLQTFGNVYSRISNPTVAALEERVAALEGGRAALAAATGMAAQMVALLTLARNGEHIVAARTLYGGTYSQLATTFAQFGIEATFVDADDPAAFRGALQEEHEGGVRRDDRQPAAQRLRHRGARGGRARRRHPARHRQHARLPVPVPAVRARRRHRHPLGDEVPRRPRHDDGRRRRRIRQVSVGQRQFPADDGSFARLSRRSLLRDVRRFRVHDESAHGDDAHARSDARAALGVPAAAGHRDAASADAAALRLRARRRETPCRPSRRRMGRLSAARRQPLRSARAPVSAARRGRNPDVRRARRSQGRRALHRVGAVPVAPRQRRRREISGDPSCVDDAPAALGGRAARRGRHARDDSSVDRARNARRYTSGTSIRRWRTRSDDALCRSAVAVGRSHDRARAARAGRAAQALRGFAVARTDVVADSRHDDRRHVVRADHPAAAAAGVPARARSCAGADGLGVVAPVRPRPRSVPAVLAAADGGNRDRHRVPDRRASTIRAASARESTPASS